MERERNLADRFDLAAESLITYFGSYVNESTKALLQKEQILRELLELLEQNPSDPESFNILITLGLGARHELNLANEAMLYCYDLFIDCVTRALHEDLARQFKENCERPKQDLPNISKIVIN